MMPSSSNLLALGLLNFFLADSRDGLGPFLDAYLSTKGWAPMDLGLRATIGGVLGLAAGMPAGALADHSHHKRLLVVAPVTLITLMSFFCLSYPSHWVVFSTQALAAVAGVLIGPAVAGITLGLVGAQRVVAAGHQLAVVPLAGDSLIGGSNPAPGPREQGNKGNRAPPRPLS